MGINNIDDIIDGLAGHSSRYWFLKSFGTAEATGSLDSAWTVGSFPVAGTTPVQFDSGGPYTCSSGTTGAFLISNASNSNWMAKLSVTAGIVGPYYIADRLWSCNMGFVNQTYTVTTPGDLPARITNSGIGCEIYIEQFTVGGAGTGTFTVNFLDPNGAPQTSQVTGITTPAAGLLIPVPLPAGVTGVSRIVDVILSATHTSGNFGVTIMKTLAEVVVDVANVGVVLDWAELGLPKIPNDACLMFYRHCSATTASTFRGNVTIIDK